MSLPDDLNELLSEPTHGSRDRADSALREKVLARTTGVLRAQRRMKRVGAVAALAGCYLAGMLTMSLLRSASSQLVSAPGSAAGLTAQNVVHGDSNTALPVTRPLLRPEDDGLFPGAGPTAMTVAKISPYDRLRRAGDRQLEDENDIAAAARTYRRALQFASPSERGIVPDKDTWLLMAMKNDRTNKLAEDMQ
jgi:hypothetical protein